MPDVKRFVQPRAEPPARKPEKTYPRRVTLDLTDLQYEALRRLAFEERVNMAELLRALTDLCVQDSEISGAAVKRVRDREG